MFAKRLFDIIFSLAGLILVLPVLIFVVIAIKLDSAGPVFFVQKRIGRGLKPFRLYKFRTMYADAAQKGLSVTVGGDQRITKAGRFLRKSKLDELPQLFNVLKGDMSLVGPRPEVPEYVGKYPEEYKEVLTVRPGITDMASLKYSDEESVLKNKENPEEYYIHVLLPEKIRMAKEYVRNVSVINDLKLILLTLLKIAYPHGTIVNAIEQLAPYRRPVVIGLHFIIFYFSNYMAYLIRFDGRIPVHEFISFMKYIPLLLVVRTIFLFVFSLDRGLWRYTSSRDVQSILFSISSGSVIFVFLVRYVFDDFLYSRAVYVLDWFLNIFLLVGVRLLRRLHEKDDGKAISRKRTIVIGAGDAAEMLLRDIEQSSYYLYKVIGLIDDNPGKKGLTIREIPILGTRKDLTSIVERERPDEFLIAIPSASPSELNEMIKGLRKFGLPVKMLPGLWNILSGSDVAGAKNILEPEDVLFRAPIADEFRDLKGFFKDRRVMITGAGGSIGSELSRQIASFSPERLILFERHEESLYEIDMELRRLDLPDPSLITPVIGDILDEKRVEHIMETYKPQIILHAAAYKHVPLMEDNPLEAFKTNVLGTKTIAEKAMKFGVERFVLVSTDKAVNPANVMGMTKKIAEGIVVSFASAFDPPGSSVAKYITVRFGNVLESSGSVVPLFKEQIKRGGPVTVTHPDITRYFMTIPEAVSLVLQATAMGKGGEVFVLDMGKPVKILDLAKRMISFYGYKYGSDIDISFIGLRPGEKLYEELFNGDEIIEKTSHPKINVAISRGKNDITPLQELLNGPFFYTNDADMRGVINKLARSLSNSIDA